MSHIICIDGSIGNLSWRYKQYRLYISGLFIGIVAAMGVVEAEAAVEILSDESVQISSGLSLFLLLACVCLILGALLLVVYLRFKALLYQHKERLRESQNHLREAQRIARMGSWERDFETGDTYWSPEALSVLGIEKNEMGIGHYESMVHPDDLEAVTEVIAAAYYRGGSYQCDHRIVCGDGHERHIRVAGQVFLGEASNPVREMGTVQDITERKLAELALKQSENRLRSILDGAPYPILILEITQNYPVSYANARAYQLFGVQNRALMQEMNTEDFWVNPEDQLKFLNEVESSHSTVEQEAVMKAVDGRNFWASLSANPMRFSGIDSISMSIIDVTERKVIQQDLERLATKDSLTGVLNRGSFFEHAQKEQRRSLRYGHPYSMLIFGLDNFKQVNDEHGHSFGDRVIIRFAELVKENLREADLFGRLGGVEFAAVLVSAENEGAYLVAERIRRCWQEEAFQVRSDNLNLTVSVGVAELQRDDETAEEVMERADAGLYRAKMSGRNCVIVFNGEKNHSQTS